jgi:hypothetical protein
VTVRWATQPVRRRRSLNAFGLKDPQPAGCTTQNVLVHQVDYAYDHYLNVSSQTKQFVARNTSPSQALVFAGCTPVGRSATETYTYDDLHRLTRAQRTWSDPSIPPAVPDTVTYDDLGNIRSKSDKSSQYTYGNGGGPHAVTALAGGITFTYDLNGNMLSGDGRGQAFDALDRPILISMPPSPATATTKTRFRYAPDGSLRHEGRAPNATRAFPSDSPCDDAAAERRP